METLLNHGVTLQEFKQLKGSDGLDAYEECVPCFENTSQNQDVCYKDIADLYDLRGSLDKAAEYRAKIKDRSVLAPYVWWDWVGPAESSEGLQEPQRKAA